MHEYAAGLQRVWPNGEELDRVAALVSCAAFSDRVPAAEDRRWVEHMLDEVARRDS